MDRLVDIIPDVLTFGVAFTGLACRGGFDHRFGDIFA